MGPGDAPPEVGLMSRRGSGVLEARLVAAGGTGFAVAGAAALEAATGVAEQVAADTLGLGWLLRCGVEPRLDGF